MVANLPLIPTVIECDALEEVPTRCPMDLALSIPLIFDKILKYLPARDLLRFSAVNCRWYARSRIILRDFKKCFARTDRVSTCADLIPWYMEMSEMSVPFNGLSINFDNREIHNSNSCSDPTVPEEFFHTEWPLKYLHIARIHKTCPTHCAAVRFIKRVLDTKSLKELEITLWYGGSYAREPWRALFNRELELPFKIAKLPEYWFANPQHLLWQLISSSPNLLELDCYVILQNVVACTSPNRYGMFKKVKFDVTSLNDCADYNKFTQSGPELVGLHVESRMPVLRSGDCATLPWRSLESMLMSSSKSLRSLELTIPIFVKLANLMTAPLFNVTELKMDFSGFYVEREAFVALQKFNFSHFLPKLTSITAQATRPTVTVAMSASEYERNSNQSGNFAGNINHVSIEGLNFHFARCFIPAFPKITAVELSHGRASSKSFRAICTHWVLLREIKIGRRLDWTSDSLDAAFCGISQHEVVELQRTGAGFLEKVNIVPTYPALRDLKHLAQLKLSKEVLLAYKETGSTLTKVTKWLAFRHLRNVTISFFED